MIKRTRAKPQHNLEDALRTVYAQLVPVDAFPEVRPTAATVADQERIELTVTPGAILYGVQPLIINEPEIRPLFDEFSGIVRALDDTSNDRYRKKSFLGTVRHYFRAKKIIKAYLSTKTRLDSAVAAVEGEIMQTCIDVIEESLKKIARGLVEMEKEAKRKAAEARRKSREQWGYVMRIMEYENRWQNNESQKEYNILDIKYMNENYRNSENRNLIRK